MPFPKYRATGTGNETLKGCHETVETVDEVVLRFEVHEVLCVVWEGVGTFHRELPASVGDVFGVEP